ncbi:MAG: hypothetical protein IPJ71_05055 [Bdellovibrionales bacterium]|nr:hypothetical protein [Bdellovibrionales bacterium]
MNKENSSNCYLNTAIDGLFGAKGEEPDRKKSFARILRFFCDCAEIEGLRLSPYHSEELSYFSKLSSANQQAVYEDLRQYYQSCLESVRIHGSLKDNRGQFRLALKKLNIQVDDGVFSDLNIEDVIEIYTLESIQIFRTFNFFYLVTYTLEEIFCRPWFELYKRDVFTNEANHKAVKYVLSGQTRSPFYPNIPTHDVYEKKEGGHSLTKIKHRFMAPAYNFHEELVGFINVFHVVGQCQRVL